MRMDLVGIGVILIGIAFVILAIYFAKVLQQVGNILQDVDETVGALPKQLDGILDETGNLIKNSNNSLADINTKIENLTPLFQVIGDLGESTHQLTSSLVDVSSSVQQKGEHTDTSEQNKKLGGIYGSAMLGYYIFKKRKQSVSAAKDRAEQGVPQKKLPAPENASF
ncbi:general stress protein [Sporosarcina sp. P31]|nr:general stress protein [Sporosarcina sp. P29]PID05475.1 general stress protein [Sporosarcina sp. P30]PID08684.1 general stress protein [Sporosarcina sp. P31]PID11686.1 general stress protein [Sporosarcina sp. P32b]